MKIIKGLQIGLSCLLSLLSLSVAIVMCLERLHCNPMTGNALHAVFSISSSRERAQGLKTLWELLWNTAPTRGALFNTNCSQGPMP
jgi:hypothetical protein